MLIFFKIVPIVFNTLISLFSLIKAPLNFLFYGMKPCTIFLLMSSTSCHEFFVKETRKSYTKPGLVNIEDATFGIEMSTTN